TRGNPPSLRWSFGETPLRIPTRRKWSPHEDLHLDLTRYARPCGVDLRSIHLRYAPSGFAGPRPVSWTMKGKRDGGRMRENYVHRNELAVSECANHCAICRGTGGIEPPSFSNEVTADSLPAKSRRGRTSNAGLWV